MSSRLLPLKPVYTLIGDELYFRDRFRAELRAAVPAGTLEFGWYDLDLDDTPLEQVLDQARTPSLMAPQQVIWVSNARALFGRGAKPGDFPANVGRLAAADTGAVVVFVADHIHLPADRQRISLEDKGKLQRIQETLGSVSTVIECGQVADAQAVALARQMAEDFGYTLAPRVAQWLVEQLDGNLGLIQREIEKLTLHAGPDGAAATLELETAEALTPAGGAGNVVALTAHIGRGQRTPSLAALQRLWAEEGDAGAIGLVFQLSRTFAMALILRQEDVRDRSGLYRTLPEGMRPPGFAADSLLQVARHMPEARMRQALALLHRADVELRSSPPSARLIFERIILALTDPAAAGGVRGRQPQPA